MLNAIVHLELERMGGCLEGVELLSLEMEVAVDHVVGEHIALLEKIAITAQC